MNLKRDRRKSYCSNIFDTSKKTVDYTMASSIPSASVKGFQDGSRYDQHRPSYPLEAVDSLLKHLQVADLKGARIVDLAAGTGKFTGLLANRQEGFEIIAVEPHDGMRVELEKKGLNGVRVLKGEASSMKGVESQSVDAVIAAQVSSTGNETFARYMGDW